MVNIVGHTNNRIHTGNIGRHIVGAFFTNPHYIRSEVQKTDGDVSGQLWFMFSQTKDALILIFSPLHP